MIERPNIDEMETLLTSLDRQRFYSALAVLGIANDIDDPDEPLSTYHVVRLGLLGWMEQVGLLGDSLTQVATVKAFNPALGSFARHFDTMENLDDKRLHRPAAGFTVLDNYAAVVPQPFHTRGYYIAPTAEWTYTLPDPALTAVTCDMSVLLMQTLTRITEIRQTTG